MDYAKVYSELHRNEKHYTGYSIGEYLGDIAALVAEHRSTALLDYGCGKGYQYLKRRVHEQWGGVLPHCYDPGVRAISEKPAGRFGGVICTDVLEHIEQTDIPGTLAELISYVAHDGFLFLGIACRPSFHKTLPDGRDVHVTIRHPSWWIDSITNALVGRKAIHVEARFDGGETYPEAHLCAWQANL